MCHVEEEVATHSSILVWEITQRSLVGYSPWNYRVGYDGPLGHEHA